MNLDGIEIPSESSFKMPAWLWAVCLVCIAVGAAALAIGFATSPRDTWLWLVVDFVIFVGLANGVMLWAAAFRVAQARWTGAVNRLGHSAVLFAPILFMVLIVLLTGVKYYAVWVEHPIPEKAVWLNVPFMIGRDVGCLAALWILCFLLVRWSLAADAKAARGEEITSKDQYRLSAVGVATVMAYAVAGTVISYDFIMSLTPEWTSTMFAPYFWITSMYAGMAILIIGSALLRRALGAERFLQSQQFHDMGNLLLGFSLFSMGLFFAQYLTIWYENLPEETGFLLLRYGSGIWQIPSWTAFLVGYAVPFVLLQSVGLKRSPRWSSAVGVLVLVGVGLERYILVVPSIQPGGAIYPVAGLGLLGFLGAFVLTSCIFLAKYPPVSAADVALRESDVKLEAVQ